MVRLPGTVDRELLDAHDADAILPGLIKTEQGRIATEVTEVTEVTDVETRLAALDNNGRVARADLAKAAGFAADCRTAGLAAPDEVRRQRNQAFLERLLIDDDHTVTGELAASPSRPCPAKKSASTSRAEPSPTVAPPSITCSDPPKETTRNHPGPAWPRPAPQGTRLRA